MLKDKCIVIVIGLVALLPVLVNYNIVGEELLWYLLKAEELLGVSVDGFYRYFVALVNLATVALGYLCFRKLFQSSLLGVLACALYTLTPVRLYLLYVRSGVGAYLAWMFLPLILLGVIGVLSAVGVRQRILNSLFLVLGVLGTACGCVAEWTARKENVVTAMTFQTIGVDSALLLCVLLWFGLFFKREKEPVFPKEVVIYTLIVVALIFGTFEVNSILMNSGNLMFV